MFDYETIVATKTVAMIGNQWDFPTAAYCYVNTWEFSCTDPNGNVFT